MTSLFRWSVTVLVLVLWSHGTVAMAAEASMSVSPKTGTFTAGNEFVVRIVLDTGGRSVNAVEGKLKYLPEDLKIVRISDTDSPIGSWTIPPDAVSELGTVSFGGIIPEGLRARGKALFTITFKALRSGETRLRIPTGAAIDAESGAGTNILTDLGGGVFVLASSEDRPELRTGGPMDLRSSTHPDEQAWYNSRSVSFEWSRTPDTRSGRFSVDQDPEGSPIGVLEGIVESRSAELEDGVWYAHLSLSDDSGWSPIGHMRVQIDTVRPTDLSVNEIPRQSQSDPRPTVEISATDERSGISHFEISIDGGVQVRWEDDGNHRYTLPTLSPGSHVVTVRAYDRAGNSSSDTLVVEIEGIEVPIVEPIPSALSVGGEIDIEGVVPEGATSRVSIGFERGDPKIQEIASAQGKFIHTFVFPEAGTYRIRAQSVDSRGATSEWTPEILVRVEERSLLGAIGASTSGGGIIAALVMLTGGLMIGMWLGRRGGQNRDMIPEVAPSSRRTASTYDSPNPIFEVFAKAKSFGKTTATRVQTRFRSKETMPTLSHRLERQTVQKREQTLAQRPSDALDLRREAESTQPPHDPTVLGRR